MTIRERQTRQAVQVEINRQIRLSLPLLRISERVRFTPTHQKHEARTIEKMFEREMMEAAYEQG